MSKSRNRLLITLVLVGALGVAAGSSHADMVKLGINPGGTVSSDPGTSPNAGEPDKPESTRTSMHGRSRGGTEAPAVTTVSRAVDSAPQWVRLAWLIWMARYLNSER